MIKELNCEFSFLLTIFCYNLVLFPGIPGEIIVREIPGFPIGILGILGNLVSLFFPIGKKNPDGKNGDFNQIDPKNEINCCFIIEFIMTIRVII